MLKVVFVVLVAAALTGCATIIDRPTEPIAIDSDPSAASLRVLCPGRNPQESITPAVVRIERRAGDCLLELSKPGYVSQSVTLEQGVNLRILGNVFPAIAGLGYVFVADDNLSGGAALLGTGLLTGGGFLVDWISGRSVDHDPKHVRVKLEPVLTRAQ
jgi:hypothetical protein